MRKFCMLFVALALVLLCIVLLPTETKAAEIVDSGTCGENLTWTLDDAGTLTISGTGAMSSYPPGTYTPWMDYTESVSHIIIKDGVTTIGYGAFSGFTKLKDVAIPASVTNIGAYAFADCSSLMQVFYCVSGDIGSGIILGSGNTYLTDAQFTNHNWMDATVTAPKNCTLCGATGETCDGKFMVWTLDSTGTLTIFGTGAMTDYWSYNYPWDTFRSSIVKIVISNGVTNIGNQAFMDCDSLTSVTIPDSVTSIGNNAFSRCIRLTNVTIPDNVTSIGDTAFYCCTSLTSINIPDSVTSIGGNAFMSTRLIYNVYDNAKYLGNSKNIYHALIETISKSITSCQIHSDTKVIGHGAFIDCSHLTSITIPDSVTGIGVYAFGRCYSLSSVTIGDGVTSIGKDAFQSCESLTSVSIPDGVSSIGDYAFQSCDSLTNVSIPASVTSIGDYAFRWCNRLARVTYCGIAEQWEKIWIGSYNSALLRANRRYHAVNERVTKEPTYTTMGEKASICDVCGEETDKTTIPAKFYGTSINLGNTLDMYFGFYTGLVDEAGRVVFVREFADGTTETTEAPITAFKKNNSVYDITYTGLSAKEMCDTIHVYVYNGEGTLVGQHSDSIRSYILRQLREKEYEQAFRTLCIDLLNYGAAAQETFGYNAGDLANKDLTAKELAEGTQITSAYADKQTKSGQVSSFYGTAYILETKISMSMAVRASYFGEGCYALVSYTDHTGTEKSNIRLEGKKNNSVYEFVLNEIVVADGRCLLTIEFYKADGTKVLTVQDSMESYTARNADIYPLAEKMLAFSDSAYNYLHRNDQ